MWRKGLNFEQQSRLHYRSISAFDSKIFALWICEYETRVLPLISEKMYRAIF